MATSLEEIKEQFKIDMKYQKTPSYLTEQDYRNIVLQGVKRLYVDEGIEDRFGTDYYEEIVDSENILGFLKIDLSLTEKEYALVCSKIVFKAQLKDDVNQLVSYTTDALAIAGADRPYRNLDNDISDLENRLLKLSFKFAHK